jgi:hypothetical protein
MADLEHFTEHAGAAFARLATQFRDKPNLAAVLLAVLPQVQALEDALFQLYSERGIDTAIGAQLDVLGRIVGEARQGKDDETFRTFIRARVLVNRSSGTIPEILAILAALLAGQPNDVGLVEYFPAAFVVDMGKFAVSAANASIFWRILQLAKAAGVRAILEWAQTGIATAFTFEDGDGLGLGDATDPTIGGAFAGAR